MNVEAPSGLVVTMRAMTGRDIQKMADALESNRNISEIAMCQLLQSCWEATVDAGPYTFSSEHRPNFYSQVLKGDIIPLLLGLRIGSFENGSRYTFDHRCTDEDCRTRYPWTIDLQEHVLDRKKALSSQGEEWISSGTPIEIESGGKSLGFRLMTLSSEEPVVKLVKQRVKRGQRVSKALQVCDVLAGALVTIDGEKQPNPQKRWEFLADKRMEELIRIKDELDSHDCDVDSMISVVCPNCSLEEEVPLPLGKALLVPQNRSRREKFFGPVDSEEASTSSSDES